MNNIPPNKRKSDPGPKFTRLDLSQVKTFSIRERQSKVGLEHLARVHQCGGTFAGFFDSLPHVLKGADLRELVEQVAAARRRQLPVIAMMGAHVIKCGLSPVIIDLLRSEVLTCVALNGAGAIHDVELAYWGQTSEDVAEGLLDGTFGMARETGEILNGAAKAAAGSDMGFGEALGRHITSDKPPYQHLSILAAGYEQDVPVTVHVAIGTDIVHQHPTADGAAIGEASFSDFRLFAAQVGTLTEGGVVLNFGSAVILPEVFLKALTVARNLGLPAFGFVTANFDMIQHYRPRVNVVERPTQGSGKGYQFVGHHEIMIPLFAAAIKERLGAR
ncbi:MAG: hypothetical protein ONB25_09825 [candidate division KSB1 bacterium]|nr:hypothetical protein [candidate division KSB1 bacterium]